MADNTISRYEIRVPKSYIIDYFIVEAENVDAAIVAAQSVVDAWKFQVGVTGRFVKNCTLSGPGEASLYFDLSRDWALEGPSPVLPQAGRLARAPETARDYPSTG